VDLETGSVAEFKAAVNQLFHGDPIVSVTVATECVNRKVVRNARKGRLGFVSPMAVGVVVPFLAVTKVLETSSFVLLMVGGSVANSMVATNLQWEALAYVLPMEVAVVVQ